MKNSPEVSSEESFSENPLNGEKVSRILTLVRKDGVNNHYILKMTLQFHG